MVAEGRRDPAGSCLVYLFIYLFIYLFYLSLCIYRVGLILVYMNPGTVIEIIFVSKINDIELLVVISVIFLK